MVRRIVRPGSWTAVVACCVLTLDLAAEGTVESPVPDGFEVATKLGRIQLHLSKDPRPSQKTKTEITTRLTALRDTLQKTYGLGVDRERQGIVTGLFTSRAKDPIDFIVFPSGDAQKDWEKSLGSKQVRPHTVPYSRTVAMALKDDAIPDEEWAKAGHDLAHVYLDLTIYTELPRWLDEGFATHIAYTNKHAPCMNMASFLDRLKTLGDRRDKKEFPALVDLLGAPYTDSPIANDQSWILVDMVIREGVWENLMGRLQEIDCAALQNTQGVADDMRKDAARFVGESFGGTSKLQSAWETHMGNLISEPDKPKKLGATVKAAAKAPICSIDGLTQKKRIVRTLDKDAIVRQFGGEIVYSGPSAGRVRITIRFGDGKGRWSRTYLYEDWGPLAPGGTMSLGREEVETQRDEKVAEFGVEIEIEQGGVYKVAKVLQLK